MIILDVEKSVSSSHDFLLKDISSLRVRKHTHSEKLTAVSTIATTTMMS